MIYLLTAVLVFFADFGFKRYMEENMTMGDEDRQILNGRVSLKLCRNEGMAGGFFKESKESVRALSSIVLGLAAVRFLILLTKKGKNALKFGYALILGGGVGNLIDRWMHGYVTDFFSFNTKLKKFSKVVFNLADIFIMVGSVITIFASVFGDKKEK